MSKTMKGPKAASTPNINPVTTTSGVVTESVVTPQESLTTPVPRPPKATKSSTVKVAKTPAPKAKKVSTPVVPAAEKVMARISDMSGEKAVHWLGKTARTMKNHYDMVGKKRKCTAGYWNGLEARYVALATQAKVAKTWEAYCTANDLTVDHEPVAVLK